VSCAADSGEIDYQEFVNSLARDTVAPMAMGKRGSPQEVDAVLEQMLGHTRVTNVKMPSFKDADPANILGLQKGLKRHETMDILHKMGKSSEAQALRDQAQHKISEHFSNMRKAFHFVDVDNSGTVTAQEIKRAMHMWGVDLEDEQLQLLMSECDTDGDGAIEYNEFIDHLARDTVAPAAMGKRGLQADEAMGVHVHEHLAHQLGHQKVKNYRIGEY
jgi:Ca2+-binding EF-hand superfamily protein